MITTDGEYTFNGEFNYIKLLAYSEKLIKEEQEHIAKKADERRVASSLALITNYFKELLSVVNLPLVTCTAINDEMFKLLTSNGFIIETCRNDMGLPYYKISTAFNFIHLQEYIADKDFHKKYNLNRGEKLYYLYRGGKRIDNHLYTKCNTTVGIAPCGSKNEPSIIDPNSLFHIYRMVEGEYSKGIVEECNLESPYKFDKQVCVFTSDGKEVYVHDKEGLHTPYVNYYHKNRHFVSISDNNKTIYVNSKDGVVAEGKQSYIETMDTIIVPYDCTRQEMMSNRTTFIKHAVVIEKENGGVILRIK